jgi:aspartate aminotransferase
VNRTDVVSFDTADNSRQLWVGRGFDSNEAIRLYLLEKAGLAVVPFQAFDMNVESGWFRMSIGAVSLAELDGAMERLESAVRAAC